jgi:predicted kinase
VIADATFLRRDDRSRLAAIAARLGRPFVIVDCEAPPEVVRERLESRRRRTERGEEPALSDADWGVYLKQAAAAEGLTPEEPRLHVDTAGDKAEVADRALAALWSWRREQPVRA